MGASVLLALSATATTSVSATRASAPSPITTADGAQVQPWLADALQRLAPGSRTVVLVHGRTLAAARDAVRAAGLRELDSYDSIGVVVARGTGSQIRAAGQQPGVSYLEGNQPIAFTDATSNTATRGLAALRTRKGLDGSRLDGSGVSVGVIDSGVDPTHPALTNRDGSSAVVANLKVLCEPIQENPCTVQRVPGDVDTDTASGGGHGTHVAGIVAGRPVRLDDGSLVQGAAPGADIVSLSTGAVLVIVGADAALNWVLENHEKPCGKGVPARQCPPIKVTNNSYGPVGGGRFDPKSATVKLQRALAAEGVLTVWAAGNDGGDGSESLTNPAGQDPTGGIISVASYFDKNTGTRRGVVSDYSSRGRRSQLSTYPDLSAPGEEITSACRVYLPVCSTGLDPHDNGDFNTISGTSMAAPHIAGIVAQLFEAKPATAPGRMERALVMTAHRFADGAAYRSDPRGGRTSFDKGHGLVDVLAALAFLRR
jgi:serine protease AprX